MPINICRVGVRRMGPDSFQWCPATGQGATGTNWGTGSSSWTWGRTSSLWGWQRTGTGCPGRLWCLLLRRYSRPVWTRSSAVCCRWPSFGRRVGLDDPQRSLPTPTILWFCDSVVLWFCNVWPRERGKECKQWQATKPVQPQNKKNKASPWLKIIANGSVIAGCNIWPNSWI